MYYTKDTLNVLPTSPGVYRMLNVDGKVIYVGKAKNLKKRVTSYFNRQLDNKTQSLVANIKRIEITITRTEVEALLLESNLIKKHRPRYNIVFRDDKSYPLIYLSSHQEYARVSYFRGKKRAKGNYFGPYPNAFAAKDALDMIERIFKLRTCTDSFFKNRSRACLKFQIERCSAPCVGKITATDYAQDVNDSVLFLSGKSTELIDQQVSKMEAASVSLDFEAAARYRDQVQSLRKVFAKQFIESGHSNVDVIAFENNSIEAAMTLMSIRNGQMMGSKTMVSKFHHGLNEAGDAVQSFVLDYYQNHDVPSEIVLPFALPAESSVAELLKEKTNKKIAFLTNVRSQRAQWLSMAVKNAESALNSRANLQLEFEEKLQEVDKVFALKSKTQRIECFDISHTQGASTVAGCVACTAQGFAKKYYRKFNIDGIEPGDDYAAMRQALMRHLKKIIQGNGDAPSVLLIDGGKGQLSQACAVLQELDVNTITIIGVAKGEDRKVGLETFYVGSEARPVILSPASPAFKVLIQLRDEAHRFAIQGHRRKRSKQLLTSSLEEIPGLGPKRRQSLIKYMGGVNAVKTASIEDLATVPGISKRLAEDIFNYFQPN